MKTQKSELTKTLTLRLSEELLRTLQARAIANQRSLNSEIVFTLQQAIDKKGK